MTRLTRWWTGRTSAAKVELYTRWSFHSFAVIEILALCLALLAAAGRPGPLDVTLALLVAVHAVLCGVVSKQGLDWALDRRERPVRPAVALAAVTCAATLLFLFLDSVRGEDDPQIAPTVISGLVVFGIGSLTLALRNMRRMFYVVPAVAAAVGLAAFALVGDPGYALGYVVGLLIGGMSISFTCGFSCWLLKTVWELERSRELKARLAVAEERLRFGRDLHDVMGRNLAVIALKSELAVQLARRGRPEAVDQMVEVQRIAQESQREVRDVVRGYREADLAVELEGARGVLAAAGIDCRVELSDRRTLPTPVQSVLGWVVREAATNVLRHGDARSCLIRLAGERKGQLVLVVENDGAPAAPSGRPGSGLAGLRERLAVLDATLEAGTVAGGRFRLTARVPADALRADRPGPSTGGDDITDIAGTAETAVTTEAGGMTEIAGIPGRGVRA
ncbi:sensor histidine kinase [Streptomyces sp. NPDC048603]|uniref:sensor histidine kinase n=1 Tax=Streptomyces sp. NPDC048603 TaxID=3365577 RepID=UPI0037219999